MPAGAVQRRRLALLALLAISGDRGMSRDRVQLYLWPDSSADRARHALDQLLYASRRDLGHDAILSGPSDLRVNPAVIRSDTRAFDEAIQTARWAEAVELYSGPLLDGFHLVNDGDFERWLETERARREEAYHRALEALAASAQLSGDDASAVQWWRRRAAADPLCAPVALSLMRALATVNDRTGAIQHARVYQQLVRVTLELEPDPAVEAMANSLAVARRATVKAVVSLTPSDRAAPASVQSESDLAPFKGLEVVAPVPSPPAPAAFGEAAHRRARSSRLIGIALLVVVLCTGAVALLVRRPPHPAAPTVSARASHTNSNPGVRPLAQREASAMNRTADPKARVLYLRARALWDKRTRSGLQEAVVLFRRATALDPEYAAAYTGLAESYAMLGYFGFAPADAMFPKAKAAALHALELDPAGGEAYAALGQALASEHAWVESEQAYRRGLELAPDNATVHQWYALMLAYVGRPREAALQTAYASKLDPLSVQINNMHGMMLYYAGDLDGALRQYERTVNAEPDSAWVRQNPWVLTNFGGVATAAGRHAQAVRLIELALRVVPTHPRPLLDLAYAYIRAGEPARARAVFTRADTTHPHYRIYHALLHAQLGELDEAFAGLNRVDEWPLPALVGLNCDPRYATLRADVRYQAIRNRLRLPPY